MKKTIAFLMLSCIMYASCRETWTISMKNRFYESCTTEAEGWEGSSPEKAQAFCDCVFKKMVEKYPHEDDALQHLGDFSLDPDLQTCKDLFRQPANDTGKTSGK